MANGTYGIKELFINMMQYIKDQFAQDRTNDARTLEQLRKLRKIDRDYINGLAENTKKNIQSVHQTRKTTEKSIKLGNIAKGGAVKKTVKVTFKDNNQTVSGYRGIGIVGYSVNSQVLNIYQLYVKGADTKKSEVTLVIGVRNLSSKAVSGASIDVHVLWTKTGALYYELNQVKLNTGAEEK